VNGVLTAFTAGIGVASLLVASASEIQLAIRGDTPCTSGVDAQVVVLDCATPSVADPHSPAVVLIDVIVANTGIRLRCRMGRMPDNASLNRRRTVQHRSLILGYVGVQ